MVLEEAAIMPVNAGQEPLAPHAPMDPDEAIVADSEVSAS